MDAPTRKRLLERLARAYPDARSELNFHGDYQMVVAVILSAQCTDKKVNEVTPQLFARFPHFEALASACIEDVESIIRPVNYYRTKAKNLIAMAARVCADFGGTLPTSQVLLTSLPGVGQKTANVVLCEQGNVPALPVDTHVQRVSRRLGLSEAPSPEGVEEDLKRLFKPQTWRDLHHRLIFHGRRVCKAQNPLCQECSLGDICPKVNVALPGSRQTAKGRRRERTAHRPAV